MKKLLSILLIGILTFSCADINRTENLLSEIKELKNENDSLKNIVTEINEKYIFDSISIKDIPYYKNTNKLNSLYETEILFVGYNFDGKSSMIFGDSISYANGMNVINGDTLESRNGAFILKRKLISEKNSYRGIIKTENKYGKKYEVIMTTSVLAKKN